MSFRIRPLIAADIETARGLVSYYVAELRDEELAARVQSEADEDICTFVAVRKRYFQQGGMFYVMTDRDRLIGIGGLRRVSSAVCELRQLNFLRPFRGRGLGHEMTISLIEWARENDYQAVRLAISPLQTEAQKLFQQLRFAVLEPATQPWNEVPQELHYELDLRRKSRSPQ